MMVFRAPLQCLAGDSTNKAGSVLSKQFADKRVDPPRPLPSRPTATRAPPEPTRSLKLEWIPSVRQLKREEEEMRNKGQRRHGGSWVPRQGRPSQAIIESNRKTELCRNWESKGTCSFGARCAFAHGEEELRYRTLREMESAGRIPDATKYRCYPCMTWVATGSCPYSSRCVFIHDPRVKGPREAWLYAGSQGKSQSAYPSSDSAFFFPDMIRDPDTLELPTHPARYDLDASMAAAKDTSTRAVYYLWYSFLSTLIEANGKMTSKSPTVATVSTSSKHDVVMPRPVNDADRLPRTHHSTDSSSSSSCSSTRAPSFDRAYEKLLPLVGSTVAVGHSMACADDCVSHATDQEGAASAATGAAAVAHRSSGTASSEEAFTACSKRCSFSLPPRANSPEVVRIPREGVQHLPVFVRLGRGVPVRPLTPPSCSEPFDAFLRGTPDCDSSLENTSSIWDTMPPEFLMDSLVPLCTKTQAVDSVGHPSRSPFSIFVVAPEGTASPGSNTGSNTASTATFSPPSTASPSGSDSQCDRFSRRKSSFASRGKASTLKAVEPWSLYDESSATGDMLAIPAQQQKMQERGQHAAVGMAGVGGYVSPPRVRSGYAVVHRHRNQQKACVGMEASEANRMDPVLQRRECCRNLFALSSF